MEKISPETELFINSHLSSKSQHYIKNELFVGDVLNGFFTSHTEQPDSDKKEKIIGELKLPERDLFIIKESLLRRIQGTKKRIDGYTERGNTSREIQEYKELQGERTMRLNELFKDYAETYNRINYLIEKRLESEIKLILDENPNNYYKKIFRYYYPFPHNIESGFDFKVCDKNKIVLYNRCIVGGD